MSLDYNQLNHAVLGGGPMGVILSSLLSTKLEEVFLWIPDPIVAQKMASTREGQILQSTHRLADNIRIVSDFLEFERNSWCFHIAVPSRSLEEILTQLIESLDKDDEFLFCLFTKGLLSRKTRKKLGFKTYSNFIKKSSEDYGIKSYDVAAVSGPSLLQELLEENHSFFQVGSSNSCSSDYVASLYNCSFIHTITTLELESMEVAGVLKNPIAIAMGIASVLPNCGSNLQGELLRTGFMEMLSFARAYNLSIEEFMGRSGLSDLITTATSKKSRNRNFGKKMVGELMVGPEKLSIIDRIEIWVTPKTFIERTVSKWHDTVEGAFALGTILELAKEKNLELPLYQTLFEVLTRKLPPISLANLLIGGKSEFPIQKLVGVKKQGMDLAAGHNFRSILVERVLNSIVSEAGFITRIKKQSHSNINNLLKRKILSERNKLIEESSKLSLEISYWENFMNSSRETERDNLKKIIEFYIKEISDSYKPVVRDSLMKIIAPLRFFSGGLKFGSVTPHLGGEIEKVKQLASRYNLLYAPRHQSHLDSVELAYALNKLSLPTPRYAAGINLMSSPFWEWMLKSLGAYSVDRERTRNSVYLECLSIYSTQILELGIPTLVYPEGTRSRTGSIVPIKTGILKTAIDAFTNTGSEIIIIPIAISYETIPEDGEFCGIPENLGMHDFLLKRKSVYLDFCNPIPISEHIANEDPSMGIATEIVSGWSKYHRILPNQIVAKILNENDCRIPLSQLSSAIEDVIFRYPGNYLTTDTETIYNDGITRLKKMHLVEERKGILEGNHKELIQYYGNMVPSNIAREF